MQDKKTKMIVMLILFSLLGNFVAGLYAAYPLTITKELGNWGWIIANFFDIFPVLIVVLIVFFKFLKKHNQKTILWCIFAIVDYRLAIIVFLLFFLDGKFTTEKSKQSLTNPIPADNDKKLGEKKE